MNQQVWVQSVRNHRNPISHLPRLSITLSTMQLVFYYLLFMNNEVKTHCELVGVCRLLTAHYKMR